MARVEPPTAQELLALQGELEEEEPVQNKEAEDTSAGDTSGDASENGAVTDVSAVAQQPWLISVKGKLLEQAAGDGSAISVTGLARAGASGGHCAGRAPKPAGQAGCAVGAAGRNGAGRNAAGLFLHCSGLHPDGASLPGTASR